MMESRSCARTSDVLHKRKSDLINLSVQHTPKKRSTLARFSQSITNSLKVAKKNRSLRKKPSSSSCVLPHPLGADLSMLNKSHLFTNSAVEGSCLNDTSVFMHTTLSSNNTTLSGCLPSFHEGDYSRYNSYLCIPDTSACAGRPPKYRKVTPNTSLDLRSAPAGASCARCSDHYTTKAPRNVSLLGQSFTATHSHSYKRCSDNSNFFYPVSHNNTASAASKVSKLNGSFFLGQQAVIDRQSAYRHQTLNCTYTQGLSLAVGEDPSSKLITASSVNNISKQTTEQGHGDTFGRVASWAVNFEKLLKDPIGVGIFTEFLKKEFSEENVIFWKACEQYRQLADEQQRKAKAKDIYTRYLSTKASEPVNVDSAARTYSEKFLDNPTAIMFDVAQQQIFQLMRQDSYARFLKSDMYKNKLMEEMEGLPLEGIVQDSKPTDSKKKVKGKENDDKRRRSILPWKHSKKSIKSTSETDQKRHSKKDKDTNIVHLNVSTASLPSTSTVTTSNGVNNLKKAPGPGIDLSTMRKEVFNAKESATESHFKFCRIVMPDGSTTVVCAKPGQTSRSVLSKLCEKRSISIASVDVFLLGSDKPLDLNEDISSLGSKEIVIERRVLFRLDLPNGKSIGVKAKPNRSIRDVFKPILTKYGYHIDSIGVHLMGCPDFLDLNLSVSELDNLRAVIVQDIDSAEILRQGVQPVAFNQTKVPPASRSKTGHFGTRGGSLEEITNRIFEDLMRGKSQLAHGFDELGVLELDKAKVHKNEEGRSLGLFGLLRKESAAVKDAHKGNKLKGKVTFTLPKNDAKKKGSTKEGERLIDMLSNAQNLRLEEQRGIHVTTGDLPSFLLEDSTKNENTLKDSPINSMNKFQLSGVAMFDGVDEISKVGFLEKTKRKEMDFSGVPALVAANNISRETKNYSEKTSSNGKWKSTNGRNYPHDNAVLNLKNTFPSKNGTMLTSQHSDGYFHMSPLIIDSQPLDYNAKSNTKGKVPQFSSERSEFNNLPFKTSDTMFANGNVPAKTKRQSDMYSTNYAAMNNLNESATLFGSKITHITEMKQPSNKEMNNNVSYNVSPVSHNNFITPKSDKTHRAIAASDESFYSVDFSRRPLSYPRHEENQNYSPAAPPPRSTPLRASSPKVHGMVSPTNNAHSTPHKRSNTPVQPVSLRSHSEIQFVGRQNTPLPISFSPFRYSDHEEETVTFV